MTTAIDSKVQNHCGTIAAAKVDYAIWLDLWVQQGGKLYYVDEQFHKAHMLQPTKSGFVPKAIGADARDILVVHDDISLEFEQGTHAEMRWFERNVTDKVAVAKTNRRGQTMAPYYGDMYHLLSATAQAAADKAEAWHNARCSENSRIMAATLKSRKQEQVSMTGTAIVN